MFSMFFLYEEAKVRTHERLREADKQHAGASLQRDRQGLVGWLSAGFAWFEDRGQSKTLPAMERESLALLTAIALGSGGFP